VVICGNDDFSAYGSIRSEKRFCFTLLEFLHAKALGNSDDMKIIMIELSYGGDR
jgi:hypothetical protein